MVIHGTRPGECVAANSRLAKEFHHHCFIKSTNFQGVVKIPGDFIDLRGYNDKITKTNITDEYCIKFGGKLTTSHQDKASEALFNDFVNLGKTQGTQINLLKSVDDYFQNSLTLDDKLFWELAKQVQENAGEKLFTLCVLGECGQGKSTLLTKVSQIFK